MLSRRKWGITEIVLLYAGNILNVNVFSFIVNFIPSPCLSFHYENRTAKMYFRTFETSGNFMGFSES